MEFRLPRYSGIIPRRSAGCFSIGLPRDRGKILNGRLFSSWPTCIWHFVPNLSSIESHVEIAVEGDVMNDVLVEAKKSGFLSQIVKCCDSDTATSLVRGAFKCGMLNDVLVEAKKSGVLSQIVKCCDSDTATSLVRGAIECGMLSDVLRAAVECGNVGIVLMGAREGDVMNDVLVEAKKSGFLSQVVKHCDGYTARSLVRGAIECGMLNDVLREAVEWGNVGTVLNGAVTVDVMHDVLVEARKSGLLSQVVEHCDVYTATSLVRGAFKCGMLNDVLVEAKKSGVLSQIVKCCDSDTATSLVRGAIECGMLSDLLRTAVECRSVGTVLKGAHGGDVMNDVLVEAKKSGLLSQVVKHCDGYTATSLVRGAIICGMLNDVQREAVAFGNVELTPNGDVMVKAKKYGVLSQAVEYYCGHSFALNNELGNMLASANASGYLRRMLMVIQRCNISRDTIIRAAKEEDIVQEVLKFVIQLFELFNATLAYILLFVSPNARSKDGGHCSSEHRKHVIDHVTIQSGDIEANPGPVFYFNDWLKEMFCLAVSLVFELLGKNIPWKKLGIPNPHNGLDRSRLKALFRDHAQIVRDAESLIPSTHIEEFKLLKTYTDTGRVPDLVQLEKHVEKRKVKVAWQVFQKRFKSLPDSDQEEVVQHLATEQIGFKLVREQIEDRDETGDAISEDEEGVSEDLGHQGASGQVEEPTEMMENRSTPVGHSGQVDEPTEIMENRSRPTEHNWLLGDSVLPPALIATSESPIEERGISEGTGKQDEQKPGPSKEQAYSSHRTTGDRIDSGDPKRPQQQGTSPPGSQQQGTSPPGRKELSADESELLDILQELDIFYYPQLEQGATASHVECQPEADGSLELLLYQHNSGTSEDTNSSKQTDADNKLTNGNDCDVSVRKDGSSPGQDRVADDKTQPDLSDDSMKWRQLNQRLEILRHNFERVTGLQNADQHRYDIVDIPVLCRKRQASSNMLQEDGSVSKYTKFE